MELNTRIAFLVTIIVGLITITFAFMTYNTYLNISVYQGKQIKTSDGQIYTEIDEFFRDDVSIPTVKHISRIIAKEIDKDVESDIYEFIKNMVRGNLNYNLDNFLKQERKEEDIENIYNDLGKININSDNYEITPNEVGSCHCTPEGISTKTCGINSNNYGDSWDWIGSVNDPIHNFAFQNLLITGGLPGQGFPKYKDFANLAGQQQRFVDNNELSKSCARFNARHIPGMLISSIGDECTQATPTRTFKRKLGYNALKLLKSDGSNITTVGGLKSKQYPINRRQSEFNWQRLEFGYCKYEKGFVIDGIPSQSQSNNNFKMLEFNGKKNEYNVFFSQGENINN